MSLRSALVLGCVLRPIVCSLPPAVNLTHPSPQTDLRRHGPIALACGLPETDPHASELSREPKSAHTRPFIRLGPLQLAGVRMRRF